MDIFILILFLYFWINKRKYDYKDLRRLKLIIVWCDSVLFIIVLEFLFILGFILLKSDFLIVDILGFDIGVL